jgi:hypothetical protein
MTTQIINSNFRNEVEAFMRPAFPSNPLPFANALADGIRENGTDYIKTDDAKALLHILNSMSHGQGYRLDGKKEHNRLEIIFRK